MVRSQKGFTIIELIVVIVILGILAAVAFPKYEDLSGSAKQAVVDGGKAALQSAAVIQLAKNNGSKVAIGTITAGTSASGVTFGGTCSAATVTYAGDPTYSATVDLSDYCT